MTTICTQFDHSLTRTHARKRARARVAEDELGTICGQLKMQCTYPRLINGHQVPCGKCRECINARIRQWSMRLMHEMETAKKAVFVTLTYDDQNMPGDGNISVSEFQRFMKRLRKIKPGKYRYYMAGEYGGTTGRPHYHAIIFGLQWCLECRCCTKSGRRRDIAPKPKTDCWYIEKAWDMGYCHIGDVTIQSCKYVANYLEKSQGEQPLGGRTKPFSLMSKGIGKDWVKQNEKQLWSRGGIKNGRKTIGMPKYYRQQIIKQFDKYQDWAEFILNANRRKEALRRAAEHKTELEHKHGQLNATQAILNERKQRERTSQHKHNLRRQKI